MAESHYDFAQADLYYGDHFAAKEHTEITADNAQKALEKSPPNKCKRAGREADRDAEAGRSRWRRPARRSGRALTIRKDKDNFEDEDGCPEPDNDKDGIYDVRDKCPNDPEDKDNFEDEDGCPDPDNDKDGILDPQDKCPNDPGPKETRAAPTPTRTRTRLSIASTSARTSQACRRPAAPRRSSW